MFALLLTLLIADDPVAKLVKLISTERIAAAHRQLTARPHIAGTAGGRAHAEMLAKLLIGYGVKTETHSYWALLSYPRRMSLRLFRAPQKNLGIALALNERSDVRDAATADADLLPGYIAYSASGRVRGKAFDAGDGLAADYDALEKAGLATEGAVAVMRLGKASIADQVALAVKHGVSGVVFYREPAKVRAWPLGPGRAAWFVERGTAASVDFPLQIPLATVSWQVVEQIFGTRKKAALDLGVELELDIRMNDSPRPIFNVIATIPGGDHVVTLGTHHDAWGFGGADPGSAESAMLELARVLGAMSKDGWRPRHTIQLAFWDGGEFGGLGASEHEKEFKQTSDFPAPDQEAFFGAYHSNYDTADYLTRWRDPGFRATRSLAETLGRAALRLAAEDVPTRPTTPAVPPSPPPDSPARGEIDYAEGKVAKAREAFAAGVIVKSDLDRATKALAEAQERYERLRQGSGQLTPAIAADEVRKAENHARVMRLNLEVLKATNDSGMVSRHDMEQAEALAKDADEYLELARVREDELTHEWELIRKVKEFEARGGRFDDSVLERVSLDYEKQFGHPLPVSAMGMTHTHELMNFDHTGRVDVALNPDSVEGKWLVEQLTLRDIPFLVFRGAVVGKATGAHIHLGLPSPRLHK
jgi:hypothetical protein